MSDLTERLREISVEDAMELAYRLWALRERDDLNDRSGAITTLRQGGSMIDELVHKCHEASDRIAALERDSLAVFCQVMTDKANFRIERGSNLWNELNRAILGKETK